MATIGIDKESLFYKYKKQIFKMTIWDTSGNERFRSLRKKYYTNWDVIIYVFDLSKRDTIDKSLLTEAKRISGPNKNLIYLLGRYIYGISRRL